MVSEDQTTDKEGFTIRKLTASDVDTLVSKKLVPFWLPPIAGSTNSGPSTAPKVLDIGL